MINSFLKRILFFALVLLGSVVYGQSDLIMEYTVTNEGKKMAGAHIQVFKNGQVVDDVRTDGKGRADILLKPNGIYTITITGIGLVTKKIEVNTNNAGGDGSEPFYYPAEVEIFPKIEGLNYSILDKPIGKIAFDNEFGDFSADANHTKSMQSALKKLTNDYMAKKEAEAANEKEKQKQYDAIIKIADKAFADEQWEQAETEYKKASALMPLETYPEFQLAELKTKLIKIRENSKRYDEAIAAAESAVSEGDLATAIAEYQRASGYKPNEETPKTKIKELQDRIANEAKAEQNYLAAIEKGDNALKANDLNTAKASFEEASKFKPNESYPKNKLAEINDILAKKEAKEKEYNDAIKAGDDALASQDYEAAKSAYQKALTLKAGEKYPTDQIAKVDGLLADAAKKEQDYLAAIEKGDQALSANDFEGAKAAFTEASKIKPTEEYPKNKIKEIEDFLAKAAAKDKEYQEKIKSADNALASKDFENAKTAYQEALSIKPTEQYPKDKISEIESALADLAKKEENYNAAIAKGDQALASKDYEAAKTAYNEALSIKSEEQYPKDKLAEIETIVLDLQKQDEDYQKAISEGDAALASSDLEKAKTSYLKASELKPSEAYPQDKLKEIDGLIAAAEAKEKDYQAAIAEGDAAMQSEDLEKAEAAFNKAASLKSEEQYPKDQLAEIAKRKEALAAEAEAAAKLEADYQAAIKEGDEKFASEDFAAAKTAFNKAIELKSEEQYPKDKLTAIEEKEKALAEEQAAAEKLEADYQAAIKEGDDLFSKEDFEGAKSAFGKAGDLKPEESYPKEQLAAIEAKEKKLADAAAAAEQLEADYKTAIEKADAAFSEQKFDDAIAEYEKAAALKTEESYPKDKIKEAQEAKTKLEAEAAEAERLAQLQKEYDALISKADAALNEGNLEQARSDFQAALALKGDEDYPKEKIEEINSTLADAAEQDQAYQDAIGKADQLLASEDFEGAKAKYTEASSIKSDEQYPKDKIAEIETKIAELAAQQEEIRLKEEAEAQLQADYEAAVKEGDEAFEAEDLDKAEAAYNKALGLKSDENYPQSQLVAINSKRAAMESEAAAAEAAAKLEADYQSAIEEGDKAMESEDLDAAELAYNKALTFKPEESYPTSQIEAINAKREALAAEAAAASEAEAAAKLEADYQAAVTEADQAFEAGELDQAESAYGKALSIKPEETYPQSQLAAIDAKREELAAAEAAASEAEAAAKLEADYQAAVTKADQAFEAGELDQAESAYGKALSIKPEETYPQTQLAAIDAKREALAAEAEAASEAEAAAKLEADYQAAVTEADQAFETGELDQAESAYGKALSIKPEETYPQSQLAAIDAKREELAAAEAAASEAEAAAKLEADYQAAVTEGDAAFESNDLDKAEQAYLRALSLKPAETYPQSQLGLIDGKREEIAIKQKEDAAAKEEAARLAKLEQDYLEALEKGDQALQSKDWETAKSAFNQAISLKSNEEYPKNKLIEIDALIQAEKDAALQATEANNEKYQEVIGKADNAFSSKAWDQARSMYQEAQKYKPAESYPSDQIAEIDRILAEKAAKEAERKLALERAAQNEQAYQTAIAEGDNAFYAEDYNEAQNKYELALGLKSDEEYPKEKIEEIKSILAEQAAEIAALEAERKAAADKENQYREMIAEGDANFSQEAFSAARNNYTRALKLKPNETYPRDQLILVNEALEKQRLAREEELKKLDEPIKIQEGPVSTIDGSAEDELDRIYKEMWAKRNSDKNDVLVKTQNKYTNIQKENREKEESRRQEALKKIEEVSVSMQVNGEDYDEYYMQNHETIVDKEKALAENYQQLERDSERKRNEQYEDEGKIAKQIMEYNTSRNNEIIEGKKEEVEEDIMEVIEFEKENIEDHQKKIIEAKEGNEQQLEDIIEFNQKRSEEHMSERQDLPATQLKEWETTVKQYTDDGDERIRKGQNLIDDKQIEVRQFSQVRKDHYKENQKIIEETTEDLKEEYQRLTEEARKRREANSDKEFYEGENKPREDRMAENYPQGVTEEIVENKNNSTTLRRIVVKGTQVDIYEKTLHAWGGVFYTKNGNNTSKEDWDANSK